MPTTRKLRIQPPPAGFVWIEDYHREDGTVLAGIATRLGITPSTYKKWRMRDQGPPTVVLGKKVAARIEAIEQYLTGLEQAAIEEAQRATEQAAHDMRPAELRTAA
ncbi:hypothetical protein [Streptomyces sp. V1I6]|uniref:hypothetical protein n=1 Tax=Streptomyces sp. V1I6 TaxID=3042273 RepID=UPI00277D4F7A|nr:hypothetical protein [Streptomyces sp. V1I6]MDQ0842465.1 hypothetical protein [Streptomyces sp. V1I6]